MSRRVDSIRSVSTVTFRAYSSTSESRWDRSHVRVREQPQMGGLAQGEIEGDVALVEAEALAERPDVGRKQGGVALGERETDVGGAHDLAGELAERLADLRAPHRDADLLHHRRRVGPASLGHLPGIEPPSALPIASTTRAATGSTRSAPRGRRALDPLGPAPRAWRPAGRGRNDVASGRARCRPAERRPRRCGVRRRSPTGRPRPRRPARADCVGQVPVDRPALPGQQLAELLQHALRGRARRPLRPPPSAEQLRERIGRRRGGNRPRRCRIRPPEALAVARCIAGVVVRVVAGVEAEGTSPLIGRPRAGWEPCGCGAPSCAPR